MYQLRMIERCFGFAVVDPQHPAKPSACIIQASGTGHPRSGQLRFGKLKGYSNSKQMEARQLC